MEGGWVKSEWIFREGFTIQWIFICVYGKLNILMPWSLPLLPIVHPLVSGWSISLRPSEVLFFVASTYRLMCMTGVYSSRWLSAEIIYRKFFHKFYSTDIHCTSSICQAYISHQWITRPYKHTQTHARTLLWSLQSIHRYIMIPLLPFNKKANLSQHSYHETIFICVLLNWDFKYWQSKWCIIFI